MRLLLVCVVLLGLVARARGQALCPEQGCTPIFPASILLRETAVPSTPPAGQDWLYASGGQVCAKNPSGTVTCMGTGGGVGGPTSFDLVGSGNNTGSTMQCTGSCTLSGNIAAATLPGATSCISPTYANGLAPSGAVSCAQVSVPQLAPATSAALAGILTDETGSGPLVFGTSPTLASPALTGTPIFTGLSKYTVLGLSPTGPAGGSIFVYAKGNQLCSMTSSSVESCGLGGGVSGPGPTVPANAIVTFNGTGGLNIQASPCTIDATGLEDCPAPLGTTHGALTIKEGQGFAGGFTWALTLGAGGLSNNFVCAIDPTTGGFPPACLDTVDIAHGGSGQTTKTNAFDALAPPTTKGDLIVYNGTDNVRQGVGADGTCVGYDSSQATGVRAVSCGGGGALPGVTSAATSTWACAATTGGLFIDTDCNVLCACNPAQAKFCRSDTGACLSASDCCAATTTSSTTTTTTTTSTTTTTLTGAPNWTTSFLAVWLMEEATGGPWVSQVGTTARNMIDASISGHPAQQDTVNKMQGTASVVQDGTNNEIATTGAGGDAIENPTLTAGYSWGCWARETHNDSSTSESPMFGSMNATAIGSGGGYGLSEIDVSPRWRVFVSRAGAVVLADPAAADGTTRGAWTHVVGVYHDDGGAGSDSVAAYANGKVTVTQTGTAGTRILTTPNNYVTGLVVEGISTARVGKGNIDECFLIQKELPATSVCRICSCGIDGSLCSCSGTTYTSSGRNATNCGTCTLPVCNQATP